MTTTKRIIRKIDEEGNVVEETLEEDEGPAYDQTPEDLSSMIFSHDNISIPEYDIHSVHQKEITTKSFSSKKVVKTIDEHGNVTEKKAIISE